MTYSVDEKKLLLKAASQSIHFGLRQHDVMEVSLEQYPKAFQQLRASFVTLTIEKQLRGCIGSLEAYQPLIADVIHNAYSAAFQDPRFYPLTEKEYPRIHIHISVLSQPEPMRFQSEEDLIQQLRPSVDGLILTERDYRGTFLPSVWESLPDRKQFLAQLKIKAGLPQDYWSSSVTVDRYTAESIE